METQLIKPSEVLRKPGEAAERLRKSVGTLAVMRARGRGPRYVVLGGNIYYRQSDLDAYINAGITDPADPKTRKLARPGGPGRPKRAGKLRNRARRTQTA